MSSTHSIKLLEVKIDCASLDQIEARALDVIRNRESQIHISCANPHSLNSARNDKIFQNALNDSEFVIADGSGITLISAILPGPKPPRITGHDVFTGIQSMLEEQGQGNIFFFGSSEEVLYLISKNFKIEYPHLNLVGTYSPPYGEWSTEENEKIVDIINNSNADVLWVGMTAPKQEKWVYKNRAKLNTPVIGSIGAVFDFFAGTIPRAPRWISKIGMEWLYRVIREPARMWKRNFVSAPLFIFFVLRNHVLNIGK